MIVYFILIWVHVVFANVSKSTWNLTKNVVVDKMCKRIVKIQECHESARSVCVGSSVVPKLSVTASVERMPYHLYSEGSTRMILAYHVYQKTWDEALMICRSEGATLMKIDTPAKSEIRSMIINPMMAIAADTWIGLRDWGGNGSWKWADGSELTYSNWHTGEPSGSLEKCGLLLYMFITGVKWIDSTCTNNATFVCERIGIS